jgi:hypothetical protein
VGQNPKPVPLVVGANIGSSQHSPAAVIPERGQITEDNAEPPSKQSWTVFHEREARSNFANDARHVGPQAAALSGDTCAFSGNADVLTGETARYHVNKSAPWLAVKGANVIPNRERREKAVILSGAQNACGVLSDFNCDDSSPSEQLAAEYCATSARE